MVMRLETLDPALTAALRQVAADVRPARDPWWIIGSAAMALHGARPLQVADIDLLVSVEDAHRLLRARGLTPDVGTGSGRFRSQVHASWAAPPLTVDLMAGFQVRAGSDWREVHPRTRLRLETGAGAVFVPAIDELIEMCRLFDRPKDHERRRMLEALVA